MMYFRSAINLLLFFQCSSLIRGSVVLSRASGNKSDSSSCGFYKDGDSFKNENCHLSEPEVCEKPRELPASSLPKKDVWKLMSDALWAFAPEQSDNPECAKQSKLYRDHLTRNTLWAVQMLESSALAPTGVLSGKSDQLGHYDSCLSVRLPDQRLSGKYCLAELYLSPTRQHYPHYYTKAYKFDPYSLDYPPDLNAWEKIKVTPDPSKRVRDVARWAVCVPAVCRPLDVLAALRRVLSPLRQHGLQVAARLDARGCSSSTDPPPTSVAYHCVKWFLLLSLFAVIAASTYDLLFYRKNVMHYNSNDKHVQLMLSYSVYENFSSLKKPDPTEELSAMHGMRVYSMFLIILGHRCLFTYGGPFHNPEFLEHRYRRFEDMLLLNGTLIVDTFFVLSGFLTYYMLSLELQKTRKLKLISVYVYRWLRITPLYMVMVGVHAAVLPQLGDGPVWKLKASLEAERCQKNWWTNLLYVNNYVHADQLCMFQSWYIACDMHYFLLAALVVVRLRPYATLALAALALLFGLAVLTPFLVTYLGHYDGVLRVYMSLLVDPGQVDYYRNVYIKSHNRAVPYVVGVGAACLYNHLKHTGFKLTGNQVRAGGLVATALALSSMCGAWLFYAPGPRQPSRLASALYAVLHRLGWATAMSWIPVAGGITGFGVLSPILCLKALVPLSRLTYSAFLVHGLVQLYSVATLRAPEYMCFPKLFWMWLGDVTSSFVLALVMYLVLEAPFAGLVKMLLQPKRKAHSKGTAGHEEYLKSLDITTEQIHQDSTLPKLEVLTPLVEEECI